MDKEENTLLNALVVDDNEVNIMILTSMLDLFHINVDQADHGAKAIWMSENKAYDIIFVDHIMPDIDGIHTTAAIRNSLTNSSKPVIIVLTSDITQLLKRRYRSAGADEICNKPIEIGKLSMLLEKYFPNMQFQRNIVSMDSESDYYDEYINFIFNNIVEINRTAIMNELIANPTQFVELLKVSVMDIQTSINIINDGYHNNLTSSLQKGLHKLKSILGNMGAVMLLESVKEYETLIFNNNLNLIPQFHETFIRNLEKFKDKLELCLERINLPVQNIQKQKDALSEEEYEQCLLNAIYYIRRFEYDSIVRELKSLILQGPLNMKNIFESALRDIRNYEYDHALDRIINLQNKNGSLPVPDNNKMIQLENFWNRE